MQPSALYRRGIILPLDAIAERNVRTHDVSKTENVRLLKIPSQGLFEALWHLGLFREINDRCSSLLDDYEEELIEASSTCEVLAAIDSVIGRPGAHDLEVIEFLKELRALARDASTLSRPLMFVL